MNTLFERSKENYKDEWLTPPPIIKALGAFDLDPCSPVNRPWATAAKHYTEVENGLVQSWSDNRVFCNPPYSDIEQWVRKSAHHNNTILLVFARTETEWFFRYIWNKADSVFFFNKRIQFYHVDGKRGKNAGAPSVLVSYGKNNLDAIEASGLQGKHIMLNYSPIVVIGISPTWISVVTIAVKQFGDDELSPVYDMVERIAPDKVQKNQHWKAKVRQSLQFIRKKNNEVQNISL